MNSRSGYDILLKLIIVGDSGVGKSCLLSRFVDNVFIQSYISTIGIDFKIKTILLDGKKVKLQIWDTAGQERFRTITTAYYRSASGILLVYDVTDRESFDNVSRWIRNISELSGAPVVLVGNKSDLYMSRKVSNKEGLQRALEYDVPFLETSVKDNHNVQECFETLARKSIQQLSNQNIESIVIHPKEDDVVIRRDCCSRL